MRLILELAQVGGVVVHLLARAGGVLVHLRGERAKVLGLLVFVSRESTERDSDDEENDGGELFHMRERRRPTPRATSAGCTVDPKRV